MTTSSRRRRPPVHARAAVVLVAGLAAVTVAACGSSRSPAGSSAGSSAAGSPSAGSSTAMLPPAPEPATAPAPARTPAGQVVRVGSLVEGIVADGPSNTVVAALRDRRLALIDPRSGRVRTTVNANGSARHLRLAKPGGPVLVPGEDTDLLTQVRLPDGVIVATARVGRQPHDADYDPRSGRVVVADELGGAVSFVSGDRSLAQLPGPVQPGGLVVTGGRAAAVDVRGNVVFVYDVAAAREIARVPMGAGLTHAVALDDSRIVVADTRGNALYVVALDGTPRVLGRLDFPEGSPYGMAVDPTRGRLWVAASGANLLVRYDVGAGADLRRVSGTVPTLQQPNSLAVDPRDGTLFVGGATTDGAVERIPPSGPEAG